MAANIIRFVLVVQLALLTGTMFGIWVGFNPASLSASAYVEQQQNAFVLSTHSCRPWEQRASCSPWHLRSCPKVIHAVALCLLQQRSL